MSTVGFRVDQLSKSFDDTRVLDDVSLDAAEGELLVLLGPSGCGKSTLLRLIAGLETADHGTIHIGDRRVDQLHPSRRDVALVFQNYSLYPHMSVAQNLAFPLSVARVPRAERRRRVTEVAELIGLDERLDARPAELSGGQRQRVALGRALIREPSLFLLDEPLSNLDAELRHKMRQEIVSLQRRVGKTMVHVTHDQVEALTMADRIALLHEGKLVQVGTPTELYDSPVNTFVASFLGQPRINLLKLSLTGSRIDQLNVDIPSTLVRPSSNEVVVGIRPDRIRLTSDGLQQATVIAREFLGDHHALTLQWRDNELTVTVDTEPVPSIGDDVIWAPDSDRLLYFDSGSGERLGAR